MFRVGPHDSEDDPGGRKRKLETFSRRNAAVVLSERPLAGNLTDGAYRIPRGCWRIKRSKRRRSRKRGKAVPTTVVPTAVVPTTKGIRNRLLRVVRRRVKKNVERLCPQSGCVLLSRKSPGTSNLLQSLDLRVDMLSEPKSRTYSGVNRLQCIHRFSRNTI